MGAGKTLAIVGGILVIVATYLLAWFTINGKFAYGVGGIMSIPALFTDPWSFESTYNIDFWAFYIVGALIILFILSPIFMLVGAKSRGATAFGSILPLVIGLAIVLDMFGIFTIPYLVDLLDLFEYGSLYAPYIPYLFELDFLNGSIGPYILLVGGLLGLISSFMERDFFY